MLNRIQRIRQKRLAVGPFLTQYLYLPFEITNRETDHNRLAIFVILAKYSDSHTDFFPVHGSRCHDSLLPVGVITSVLNKFDNVRNTDEFNRLFRSNHQIPF